MTKGDDRVVQGIPHSGGGEMSEAEIDNNLVETFPASDPPSWTLGTDHREEPPEERSEAAGANRAK